MDQRSSLLAARGLTDDRDRLLTADEALADLHERCGGSLPGTLAIPELLDLVQQGRSMGLRIAREFSCFDGEEEVSGFARVRPLDEEDGGGCELLIDNWQRSSEPQFSSRELGERIDAIDRASAEVTARLDSRQYLQLLNANAEDTQDLAEKVRNEPGQLWTYYLSLRGVAHQQPLHWRLLDGAVCTFEGSERTWRARLIPIGPGTASPRGFELLLVADEPLIPTEDDDRDTLLAEAQTRMIGRTLAPVLRQPVSSIIANAESIRAKLAGPLRAEYSEYAGNIAAAGQHLSGMLDDLADLEVVEAANFSTLEERVDLGDAARRAAGILGVRAQAKAIKLDLPPEDERCPATAEFRRVLQILINLIGNAIAYSPEQSTVTIGVGEGAEPGTVALIVEDQGPGISTEQAERIFDKFERLGRSSDGGSGLGLYISQRLANAMKGKLDLADPSEAGGNGARFRLTLPRYE
ncbi:sensor histidine kinase KdpD [Erythrobacter sp. YT30]|uniref:sensor histidine kinase n=1 Tax=Erythrobacter sp. YT30 TaxID=1735012 RepID=UPI00076C210C|nr:HAMP domain-containing sensor histidine kinase [Erythrobacter sp. YT30]KWV93467.1 histidine kinase [Erythrobacter sp. YT30]